MMDTDIQYAVLRELDWEPQVGSTEVGVSVMSGVVTLSGFVDSYTKKYAAEKAAKRVAGVKAVANDVQVHLPSSAERDDPDIAQAAVTALKWRIGVPQDNIVATVRDGWITLDGEVDWRFQSQVAESAVRDISGVKGVTNLIKIKQRATPNDLKEQIEEAMKRSAGMDAQRVTVELDGSTVTLRGALHSWAEREDAERVVWRAPGVTRVEDYISVEV